MKAEDTVERKPDLHSPATPISTPISSFNHHSREDELKQTVTDLRNREDQLNSKNMELKNQLQHVTEKCASLEARCESFRAEKEKIEAELKKCKEECEAYRYDKLTAKYEVEKARLDLKMLREKEDMMAETCEKRIAEVERESEKAMTRMRAEIEKLKEDLDEDNAKGKEEVGRLTGEMACLMGVKRKAEEASRYWETSFKRCEPRVEKLEKEVLVLLRSEPGAMKVVEKTPSLRGILDVNRRSVIKGNPDLTDENARASPCDGSSAESPRVDTNAPVETGPHSSFMMASRSRMPTDNQVLIEIESDEEKSITETAFTSKTDKDHGRSYNKLPASQSISGGKRPLVCTKNNGDVGNADCSNKSKNRKMDSAFPNKG